MPFIQNHLLLILCFICSFALSFSLCMCICIHTHTIFQCKLHTSRPFTPQYFSGQFLRIRISFYITTQLATVYVTPLHRTKAVHKIGECFYQHFYFVFLKWVSLNICLCAYILFYLCISCLYPLPYVLCCFANAFCILHKFALCSIVANIFFHFVICVLTQFMVLFTLNKLLL